MKIIRYTRLLIQLLKPVRQIIIAWSLINLAACKPESATRPYNILLITIDDLRPELGCYGTDYIHSPHIDRIASEGFRFNLAYCSMSWCAPSRTSLLTGLRPGTTGVMDLQTHFREKLPDAITLPQYFKQNGYTSLGFGKVYHNDPKMQDSLSWTGKCWIPPGENPIQAYATEENLQLASNDPYYKANATESADVPDDAYPDGQVTLQAIQALRKLQESESPFFLGVGFYKPHLPFTAPSKYWNLYKRDEIPLSSLTDFPTGSSPYMFRSWSETGSYQDINIPEPYPESLARRLKHGYAACVSFIDAQVGMIMNEMENLGLLENTIIVIWGDHGWKLGEYGRWSKHSNMEVDTRVPLIIKVPGQKPEVIHHIVETIDIYPTLARLAGLEVPKNLDGEDLLHKTREFALSQITHDSITGYSVRTTDFRYIEWKSPDQTEEPFEKELYDHRKSGKEMINLSNDSASQPHIPGLQQILNSQF